MADVNGSDLMLSGGYMSVMSPLLSVTGKPVQASGALAAGVVLTVVGLGYGAGEVSAVTVEKASDGSRYVINASEARLKALGVAVGTSVRVTAESTGYVLVASGQMLAFIPNEVGTALLHQSRVSAGKAQ
ncbi:hypothetical protein [Jeongeupia chitinilytica]|uniref:hypothetical protein n=1 Tax=Jeongeupia chitinilytica TaxID=1041641 RepID=UPI001674F6A8|nr:hypothetical protein [Jeongeupia chitinilytica]